MPVNGAEEVEDDEDFDEGEIEIDDDDEELGVVVNKVRDEIAVCVLKPQKKNLF